MLPPTFIDASFAMIRHPVERLRSVFVRHRDIEKNIPSDTEFDDWCTKLPLRGFALDNHTRPMRDFIPKDCKLFCIEDGFDPLITWLDTLAGDEDGPRQVDVVNSHAQKLSLQQSPGGEIPPLKRETISLLANKYAKDMMMGSYESSFEEKTGFPLYVFGPDAR